MGKLQVTNTNNNQKANLYLTNVLYDDEERHTTAEVISSIPSLLSDHISIVVDNHKSSGIFESLKIESKEYYEGESTNN